MSERSEDKFVATCREAVQIGPDDYRMESVSKVFDVSQPMRDDIEWARRMGVDGLNSVTFSELDIS